MSATLSLFDRPAVRMTPAGGPPAAPAPPFALRPYQEQAIAAIAEKLGENRSTLLVLPTGVGKTATACSYVQQHERGRVLWLAHREELLDQGRAALKKHTGEYIALEKAEVTAIGSRVVAASVQTLKGGRLSDFAGRFPADLIVVDEAHHAPSPSYRAIFDAFPGARVLGLTATPDRADEKAMGIVFDSVAFVYEIEDAIREGYLCPFELERVHVDAIDLRAVRTVGGDLNQADLAAAFAIEEVLQGIVVPLLEKAGDRRTISFSTSVANAHRMAEISNRIRAGCARAVDGETPSDQRREILNDHRAGAFQFLYNVGVLTEGYDDPAVSCIAMARPTKSRSLYAQCAGRGLRIAPGKDNCLILDFVGNSGRHGLASGLDILAGRYDDETRQRALEMLDQDEPEGGMAQDVLEQAAKALEEERSREAARRAGLKAKVTYRTEKVSPFDVFHIKDPDANEWSERYAAGASERQIETLQKFGMEINGVTKAQASKLIGTAIKRRELGLATFKQLRTLKRSGIDAVNISFPRASKIIDQLVQNRWRPLPAAQLSELMERAPGEDG